MAFYFEMTQTIHVLLTDRFKASEVDSLRVLIYFVFYNLVCCALSILFSKMYFLLQSEDTQQQIIRETFHLVSKRDENVCNFLEGGL